MMKTYYSVAVFGAGQVARTAIMYLRAALDDFDERMIGCFVTENKHNVKDFEGFPVYTIDELFKSGRNVLLYIAVKDMYIPGVIQKLDDLKISNYKVFKYSDAIPLMQEKWKKDSPERYRLFLENYERSIISDEEYLIFLSKQVKNNKLDFEINIADHCNLNCQSCNHFSPLAEENYVDEITLDNDLARLQEVIEGREGKIMLLGGEPLLHPRIERVIEIVRNNMPNATIDIITNGILIPKMKASFWKSMRVNDIGLGVTKYPINFDYERCEKIAQNNKVSYTYGFLPETIKTTYLMPINDEAKFNPFQMYMKCAHANYCVVLREGRLYNCSFTPNVHHYNKYFNKDIPCGDETSISIYEAKNWNEVCEFLKRPNKMCSHCDICGYKYDIPWNTSKKDIHEWMG